MIPAADGLRILILEDVPMDAELVEYELRKANVPFSAHCVNTREDFLAALAEFTPDLILSDYTLPSFDGMSALFLAKELAPSVPFIVVTGSINEETAVRCMKAGATDYLLKSNLARIGPAIEAALARQRVRGEKERADRALRESEERYRDLFDSASDLICTIAPDARLLYVNSAWRETLGYPDSEIGQLRLFDLVHPDHRDAYREIFRRVLAGEELNRIEVVFVTKAGESVVVEGNTSCTFEDSAPATVRGIFRDITERKRVQEQLLRAERMQAAGKLAGGVAHEVNNMMTAVIGFSDFLLRGLERCDPRRAEVEEILKAANRAATVTRQLLAFTRQQFMQPRICDLSAVVAGTEPMLRRSLGEDRYLVTRLAKDIGWIKADKGQLEQVLINLVLNSRDAMGQGGRVTIETESAHLNGDYAKAHGNIRVPSGHYVMLAVSDTGHGMDATTQARIFEPFYTTKPVGQGTGLGLSTVYGIVKQSGGFIWVYSEPRQGTTFKIYLPAITEAGEAYGAPEGGRAGPARGSETILVVEDEDTIRHLASRIAREYGYTVVEARNGQVALERVLQHRPAIDLVISDVVMPEMGGREFSERLALVNPSLPVLFMSGYTGEDIVQRGLLDPGSPFLQKPFTPGCLATKVREMLDARPQRALRETSQP